MAINFFIDLDNGNQKLNSNISMLLAAVYVSEIIHSNICAKLAKLKFIQLEILK